MTGIRISTPTASIDGLEAKFVDVDGIRTRYYELGRPDAAAMLLCHGGLPGVSDANVWSLNLAPLGQHFHVFAADKLASGLTDAPAPDVPYTMALQTRHMYRFLQTVGISSAHLVGQSFGGLLITRLALHHAELARSMVIVDSATTAPEVGDYEARRQGMQREPARDEREAVTRGLHRLSFDRSHISDELIDATLLIQRTPAMQAWKRRWATEEPRFMDDYQRTKLETLQHLEAGELKEVPTLLYWARNDPTAILEQGRALFDLLATTNPRLRMIEVNHAGHFHFREYPDEFVDNVTRFIQRFAP